MSAIVVEDLRKSYGDLEAVRGISFEVPEGRAGLAGVALAVLFFSWEPRR